MLFSLSSIALVSLSLAQRPANISMCDYYTTAVLKENTAANQYALLTKLVNTVLIGNYTAGTTTPGVVGILAANATYMGAPVSLGKYFNGALNSTNVNGAPGMMNFLDDGGAAPLLMDKPSNGNMTSNQYILVTHLYEFFGQALGCTKETGLPFPVYDGDASMYDTHKFMNLTQQQIGFFNSQVGLAAVSLGVSTADATAVGTILNSVFNVRCALPISPFGNTSIVAGLQYMCVDKSCPLASGAALDTKCAAASSNSTTNPASSDAYHVKSSIGLCLLAAFFATML